jgi:RNA polymerase sigma-70 factor (ECF subfamily)
MSPTRQPVARVDELLRHADWVHGLAHRLVVDSARADDLVQETWLVALERGPRHSGNLRAWLGRVVTSLARSSWRSETRRARRELTGARREALPSTEDLVQEASMARTLSDAVLELDEPFRSVLLLRYFRDRTPTEIARDLDRPVATVKTQLQRGLHRLRDRLDDEFEGGRDAWTAALLPLALAGAPAVGTLTAVAPAAAAAAGLLVVGAVAVRALEGPSPEPLALEVARALEPPPLRSEGPPEEEVPGEAPGEASAVEPTRTEAAGSSALAGPGSDALAPLSGLLLDAELRGLAGQALRWRDPGRLRWANPERTLISGPRTWLPLLPETRDALERDPAALERFAAEHFPRPELAVALFRGEEPPEYTAVTRTGGEFDLLVPEPSLELELDDGDWGLLGTAELELERRRRVWIAAPRRRHIGLVVDAAGAPVVGVRVVARAGAPGSVLAALAEGGGFTPMRHEGVSDERGEVELAGGRVALTPAFRVSVLAGDEWVELTVDPAEPGCVTVGPEGEVRFRIALPPLEDPLITLRGRVLLADGSPAPRAVVVHGGSWARTDAEGRYEIGLSALEGELRASRAGSGLASFEGLALAYAGLSGVQAGPELRLAPASLSISGRVVDGEGAPVAGAHLRLLDDLQVPGMPYSLEDLSGARTLGHAVAGLDGGFELDGLLAHDYRVVVEHGDQATTSAPIPAGTIGRELVLERRD